MPQRDSNRPTMRDVAREAGLSISTVSRLLISSGYVRPDTRDRIMAAVRRLGYRPNAWARRRQKPSARLLALVTSMPPAIGGDATHFGAIMEIAAAATTVALASGCALVAVPPAPRNVSPLTGLDVDGALVVSPTQDDKTIEYLKAHGLPVVTLGPQPGPDPVPYVDLRNDLAAEIMLEHLRQQGARKLAVFVGRELRDSHLKIEAGYLDFCRRVGQEPIVYKTNESLGEAAGAEGARWLLRHHPEVDGLCASQDAFAVGAVKTMISHGRAVPRDVKVVTRYDGQRGRLASPPLSAVELHLGEAAGLGVTMLLKVMGGETPGDMPPPPTPYLVARASSAADMELDSDQLAWPKRLARAAVGSSISLSREFQPEGHDEPAPSGGDPWKR